MGCEASRGPPMRLPLPHGPQAVTVNPAAFEQLLLDFRDVGALCRLLASHGDFMQPRQAVTALVALGTIVQPGQHVDLNKVHSFSQSSKLVMSTSECLSSINVLLRPQSKVSPCFRA